MYDYVNESLLEMHYFHSMKDFFAELYGANVLEIIKPSTQHEKWVGFDQGWISSQYKTYELFQKIKKEVQENEYQDAFYVGYFFQFKKVQEMKRVNPSYYPDFKGKRPPYSIPYYRVELSLKKNKATNLSQHETLIRLAQIEEANVFYACAMLFDIYEIYNPNLRNLKLVNINSNTNNYPENERHFITFQNRNDLNPYWNSEPIEDKAFDFEDLFSLDQFKSKELDYEGVKNLIFKISKVVGSENSELKHFPSSLVLIKFSRCK